MKPKISSIALLYVPLTFSSDLVCAGMSSEKASFIDVKVVGLLPADVVFGDQQRVKVLVSGDYRVKLTVHREERVASRRQVAAVHVLDDALGHVPQGVVGLQVQVPANVGQQVRRHIGHVVAAVFPSQHFNLKVSQFLSICVSI